MNKFERAIKNLELICTLDSPKLRKSLDIAKKALSKRVPKKVIFEDVGYDFYYNENVYACICPSCGLHILNFTDSNVEISSSDEPKEMFHACLVHHAYEGRNNFCNRCGQALFAKSANDYEFPIEAVAAVLNRLAEYEDSGLEPYHIPGVLADCHKLVEECRKLKAKNSDLKRLLKLAMEDMQYFSRHDFEPAWKCEVCEKFVQSGKRCESMTECNFIWYKLKECELIFKGDKVIAWMPLPEPYKENK